VPAGVLVAACAFSPRLGAERVAEAIARGLREGGLASVDLCPLQAGKARAGEIPARGPRLETLLDAQGFDPRMRAARALVVAERRLAEPVLAASVTFELATRARQSGVPAYAIAAANRLDSFDARMLDLQEVVQAADARALRGAGRRLAALIVPRR
jgi:glycerate kinase